MTSSGQRVGEVGDQVREADRRAGPEARRAHGARSRQGAPRGRRCRRRRAAPRTRRARHGREQGQSGAGTHPETVAGGAKALVKGGRLDRVDGLWRSEKRRSLVSASAKRRISSARRSSGSITASTTISEARWRMSMSAAYSSRLRRTNSSRSAAIVDLLDLVVEDRVDRRLRAHHRDRGRGQRDAAVRLERRARPSRRGRRRRPCGRPPRASARSPRRRPRSSWRRGG